MYNITLYIMSTAYILAGIYHFVNPRMYLAIMPPAIPFPKACVIISGLLEIVLGVGLLFPETRVESAWGLIVLLILIFPANIYMATSGKFRKIPKWILYLRLPLQIALIAWAYQYI